jgi:hypothetical protein
MFEVGGHYANRKGKYEVLEVSEPKMTVRFEDGTTAELNMNIQLRIWENIVAEEEVKQTRSAKMARLTAGTGRFFIHPVSALTAEELVDTGWKDNIATDQNDRYKLVASDRMIYYAIENQTFFAVATVTGTPSNPTKKDILAEPALGNSVLVFPVEVDARSSSIENGLSPDAIEFESQPAIKTLLRSTHNLIEITEDEFELLAELLTEVAEEEEEDEDDLDDDDDDDDFDD